MGGRSVLLSVLCPGKEELTHPNVHPGAADGQEIGCLLKQSAAIV